MDVSYIYKCLQCGVRVYADTVEEDIVVAMQNHRNSFGVHDCGNGITGVTKFVGIKELESEE